MCEKSPQSFWGKPIPAGRSRNPQAEWGPPSHTQDEGRTIQLRNSIRQMHFFQFAWPTASLKSAARCNTPFHISPISAAGQGHRHLQWHLQPALPSASSLEEGSDLPVCCWSQSPTETFSQQKSLKKNNKCCTKKTRNSTVRKSSILSSRDSHF